MLFDVRLFKNFEDENFTFIPIVYEVYASSTYWCEFGTLISRGLSKERSQELWEDVHCHRCSWL